MLLRLVTKANMQYFRLNKTQVLKLLRNFVRRTKIKRHQQRRRKRKSRHQKHKNKATKYGNSHLNTNEKQLKQMIFTGEEF